MGEKPWRAGDDSRVYDAGGAFIGAMRTPELAAVVVDAVNGQEHICQRLDEVTAAINETALKIKDSSALSWAVAIDHPRNRPKGWRFTVHGGTSYAVQPDPECTRCHGTGQDESSRIKYSIGCRCVRRRLLDYFAAVERTKIKQPATQATGTGAGEGERDRQEVAARLAANHAIVALDSIRCPPLAPCEGPTTAAISALLPLANPTGDEEWSAVEALTDARKELAALAASPPVHATTPANRNIVAGERMDRSIEDFVRACEVHIQEIAASTVGDSAVLALLCDAVRLAREYVAATEARHA